MDLTALRSRTGGAAKVIAALSIFVGLAAWAVASPVGASPDEDYHLVSTWCGQGVREDVCDEGADEVSREVPSVLLDATCYAFNAGMSAQCQGEDFANSDSEPAMTARGNFSGDYPPVFYLAMSLFVGDDVSKSVIAMRLANALLFVSLMGATCLALPAGLRRPMIGAVAVTAVPLGIFLIPSLNPSSWAILSAATLMVTVLGYITAEERRRRVVLGALAAVSMLLGAGARADAAIYGVVAIGAAMILTIQRDRAVLRRMIYPVALALAAAWSFLAAGQSSAVAGPGNDAGLSLGRVLAISLEIPALWIGGLGTWGLGWLDTAMPSIVWVFSGGVFAAVLFSAMSKWDLRRGLAIGAVGFAVYAIPTYIQLASGVPVGTGVQPRYILPLLTILVVVALVRLKGDAFRLSAEQRWIVVVALTIANSVALHVNLRRYVTGLGVPVSADLNDTVNWWWGLPISPMAVWVLGTLGFGIGLALVSRELVGVAPALPHRTGVSDSALALGGGVAVAEQPDPGTSLSPYGVAVGKRPPEEDGQRIAEQVGRS